MSYKSFDECLTIVERLIPQTLKSKEEYKVLLKILAYAMQKNYELLNRLDNAYNVDFVDLQDLPRLADTVGIVYPVGADAEVLRLLLKYNGKIIKNRGTIDSIKQMVRLLEYSETQLYAMSLEDYTNVSVDLVSDGFILVRFDGITDFDYAYRMLRKVVPAGYRFEVANVNGPIIKGFDFLTFSDTSPNLEVVSNDSGSVSESVLIEEN